jgi:hypothetical protein
MKSAVAAGFAVGFATLVGGCGLAVQSGDDFLLTRVGAGTRVTLLVNDGGTIRCNGGAATPISNALLISARDLVDNLDNDAKQGLNIPSPVGSVYRYTVRMQDGTISFPDTAAAQHTELAGAEEYVLRALAGPCRRS